MDITYHYPPELLRLLIDTIPRLCRSKQDVFTFFRGAGVQNSRFSDIRRQWTDDRESINKFEIARTVLTRLNEAGESALRERREVLKRVVEFEDFTTCWPNDRIEAQGLVSSIQKVVNVKDSFTRINQERESEVRKRREAERVKAEEIRQKKETLASIRQDFNRLFTMDNPQERGLLLEDVLNRFFDANEILIRDSFRRVSDQGHGVIEQVDGVIVLDGEVYLVEMKWLKEPVGVGDVSHHLVRIFTRSASRGIFISYSGYTNPAIKICKESLSKLVISLCTVEEFAIIMEKETSLVKFLKAKIHSSMVDKQPFTQVLTWAD